MGILDNVERGLERAVNGAFAKTFRAKLQPVELASALRRELDTHAAVLDRERTVAPNSFHIRVSTADLERLRGLGETLTDELVAAVSKHAARQGYQLAGPAEVDLVEDRALGEGMLAIDSETVRRTIVWAPALDIAGQRRPLTGHRTVIGRSSGADITIDDPGISRQHLEILWEGDSVTARDLGSTNGSRLDGHTFTESALRPDAVLTIGHTRIVYRLVPRRGREEDARDGRAADPSALGDREPWERDDVEGPDSGDPFRANPYAEDGSEHEGLENPYRDDSRREGSAPGGREPWETEPPEPEGAGRDEGSGEEGSGREPWESEPGERQ